MAAESGPLEGLVKINFQEFFGGKKIFVTGHTGFKGSWLCIWLQMLGARVAGYSLQPPTEPSLFEQARLATKMKASFLGDVRDAGALGEALKKFEPEIVFHFAAQPLVLAGFEDPSTTFSTNVLGTLNLLEAVRKTPSVKISLIATSDKCYGESGEGGKAFSEQAPLGGQDPYSASKACQEQVAASYRHSYSISLSTVRCGNVVGGGDWEKSRIVPDCIAHLSKDLPVPLRMPQAVRPWQFVLDALSGYLSLARAQFLEPSKYAGAWNFGPEGDSSRTVSEVAQAVIRHWGKGDWVSKAVSQNHVWPEAHDLRLDAGKAKDILKWRPLYDFDKTISETSAWYKASMEKSSFNAFDFSQNQILGYSRFAEKQI